MNTSRQPEENTLCKVGGVAWMVVALFSVTGLPLAYLSNPSLADLSTGSAIARGLTELQTQGLYFAGTWMSVAGFEFASVVGFLGLYFLLRKTGIGLASLGLLMWTVGVAIDVVGDVSPRLAAAGLSNGYVAATTDAQRAAYVVTVQWVMTYAGVVAFATGVPFGLALILAGYLMLRSGWFNRATAYTGIAAGVLTLAIIPLWGHGTAILVVTLASAVPTLLWAALTGYGMYRLGSS